MGVVWVFWGVGVVVWGDFARREFVSSREIARDPEHGDDDGECRKRQDAQEEASLSEFSYAREKRASSALHRHLVCGTLLWEASPSTPYTGASGHVRLRAIVELRCRFLA